MENDYVANNANANADADSAINAMFQGRIREAIATAQAWEDESLLTKIRASIPFAQLADDQGPYSQPIEEIKLIKLFQTTTHNGGAGAGGGDGGAGEAILPNLIFLQRLARYFKSHVMTWVNAPPCEACGSTEMNYAQTRGPQTEFEQTGQAVRVEEYTCRDCNQTTSFGRYNNPHTLFQTKQGRCGEFANLFGAYCRAVGLETRYVTDFTDHVWTECNLITTNNSNTTSDPWIMVDSCEGVVNEPSMYEVGWQKKLNYVLASTHDSIVDVTPRYTRQFYSDDLQARRRAITTSESDGEELLRQANQILQQQQQSKKRSATSSSSSSSSNNNNSIQKIEEMYLRQCRNSTEWNQTYEMGRISGSYSWKVARQEQGGTSSTAADATGTSGGDNKGGSDKKNTGQSLQWAVENYCCPPRCTNDDSLLLSIQVFSPQPTTDMHSITSLFSSSLLHAGIVVNGTPCAVGENISMIHNNNTDDKNKNKDNENATSSSSSCVSVVVIDEEMNSLGCILQSRSFYNVRYLTNFVERLPTGRIVAMQGKFQQETDSTADNDLAYCKKLQEELLVGLTVQNLFANGILFVGQVRIQNNSSSSQPESSSSWVICKSFTEAPHGIKVSATKTTSTTAASHNINSKRSMSLKTYRHTRPSTIVGRLDDDSVMPLATQLSATHQQKRDAFVSWSTSATTPTTTTTCVEYEYAGYTTQPGAPIYLLGPTSYPLIRLVSSETEEKEKERMWATFLWLPAPLVPKDDVGIVDNVDNDTGAASNNKISTATTTPLFDVPLETMFFTSHLGHELLVQGGSSVDTVAALANARLIGLYFSAHWCGPCRSFTPMLAEMYQHLKEAFPTHGLEIVFVSSDRDLASFNRYFASMPWMALPMASPDYAGYKQLLSNNYGVRGIPSLVILDAMSGQVVVGANVSRGEVLNACNQGDEGIEELFRSWLERVPIDTKEMVAMLEASCCIEDTNPEEAKKNQEKSNDDEVEPAYLYRPETSSKEETAARVKAKFTTLVEQHGMSPNEAAAKAIAIVSGQTSSLIGVQLSSEVLTATDKDNYYDDYQKKSDPSHCLQRMLSRANGAADAQATLSTLLKYVENLQKQPWTPKFRQFKLSNKVADRMIRGLDLVQSLGIQVAATESDYCGYFPIGLDLEQLAQQLHTLLEQAK